MKSKLSRYVAKLFVGATILVLSSMSYATHDPVIIMTGASGDLSKTAPLRDYLRNNGWPDNRLFHWKDSTGFQGDVPATANEISAKVNSVLAATGASKVVLVGFSSSAISSRYYIKNLGGTSKVSQFISIAGPHHGISRYIECQYLWKSCAQWGPIPLTPFMQALNSGTEVPGWPNVKYLTLRGTADKNASPTDTAMLAGADENALFQGLDHYTLITNASAQAKVRDFIIAHETPGSTTTTTTSSTTTTTAGACFKTSNTTHVTAGRATNTWGSVYAKGSNQYMGTNSLYIITKLRQTGVNYYKIDSTCP